MTNKNILSELLKNSKINELKTNWLIIGTISVIEKNFIMVNLDLKCLSKISINEFSLEERKNLKVGQEIEVLILKTQTKTGETIVSYEKAKMKKKLDFIEDYYLSDELIEGTISKQIKGGYEININDIKAFLPISLSDLNEIEINNEPLEFQIIKFDRITNNIIVSRKFNFNDNEDENIPKVEILERYEVDQIVQGTVKNITDYGVFVNLGDIDGLVHITDISWKRIKHPNELLKKNDVIDVIVLKIDYENEKMFLGIKQLQEDPWKEIYKNYPKGTELIGKISNFTDYGVFVEIEPGIEGLLHNTNLKKFNIIKEDLKIDQNINVWINNIDYENKKISLNLKNKNNKKRKKIFNFFLKKNYLIQFKIININYPIIKLQFNKTIIFINLDKDLNIKKNNVFKLNKIIYLTLNEINKLIINE